MSRLEKGGLFYEKQRLVMNINFVIPCLLGLEKLIAEGTIDQWTAEYSAKAQEVGA